jgi:hypothetical protein
MLAGGKVAFFVGTLGRKATLAFEIQLLAFAAA